MASDEQRNTSIGRVAIVAGAGPLGRETAAALAKAGFVVVGLDRSEDVLRELPDGIRGEVVDPTDPDQAKAVVDRVAGELGPPHVLVNTIGAFALGDALSATPEVLQQMFDVNLGPALWLSQAAAAHMQQAGGGVIVHVAARPALEPTAGMAAYSLSKAALVHLVRILDLELRPHGIRVNAVAPLLLDTPRNRAIFPPDVVSHAVSPAAVAEAIAFLISDAAAPISGAIMPTYGE